MARSKEPAIVAELGRPETPEETAARKAENSRKHRANQTLFNLVVALIASLGIVLFLVVVVVRPAPEPTEGVDYTTIAADAQGGATAPLLAPALPGWTANAASFETTEQVPTWYIGFLTPKEQFIGLNQGIDANPTWQSTLLEKASQTGSTTIEGVTWQVFDRRDAEKPGNFAYSLATTHDDSTVLIHGTADDAEFEALASAIAAQWATP